MTCVYISSSNFIILCTHTKQFVLIIEFPVGCYLEMWRVCIAVPVSALDKNTSNEWVGIWHCNATTSHFKIAAHRKFSDQNKSFSMNYIQIWAADADTSWGKFLFEIDIVGRPNFPLKRNLKNHNFKDSFGFEPANFAISMQSTNWAMKPSTMRPGHFLVALSLPLWGLPVILETELVPQKLM